VLALITTLAILGAQPDANDGRALFFDPGIGQNGVACATCHATLENGAKDGDGLIRSGGTMYGVAKRKYWRGDQKRTAYPTLADAVDVCVQMFQGGSALQGRERLAMDAFLKSISPKADTPIQIDPELEADLDYAREKYMGGDADAGRGLFFKACSSCHPKGGEGVGPSIRGKSVADVAKKVREGNGLIRGTRKEAEWMPFYGANRLKDKQLADIAAWVSAQSNAKGKTSGAE
jgi:mono/diheme cytochrome c family protein